MKTKIEVSIEKFENAVIFEDSENIYIDLKTGLQEAIYPKESFTINEAIEDQVNLFNN